MRPRLVPTALLAAGLVLGVGACSDDAEDTDEGLQVAAWWGDGLAGTMRAKGNVVCCKRRETRESVVSTLF